MSRFRNFDESVRGETQIGPKGKKKKASKRRFEGFFLARFIHSFLVSLSICTIGAAVLMARLQPIPIAYGKCHWHSTSGAFVPVERLYYRYLP